MPGAATGNETYATGTKYTLRFFRQNLVKGKTRYKIHQV